PVWFLPFPVGLEFGREITFSVIIIAAFILWLLSVLTQGQMRYPSSPLLWATGFLAIVFGVSTFLSKAPLVSLIYGDPIAERFSTLFLGILFMLLSASVYSSAKEIKRVLLVLIYASGIAGLIAFFQLAWGISLFNYLSPYAQGVDFNAVGTMNGFTLFMVVIFVITLGFLFSSSVTSMKAWMRYTLAAVPVILMLNMLMIHFSTAWTVLIGSLIFFFGLMFMHMRSRGSGEQTKPKLGLDWRYSTMILLIALSVVMLVVRTPFFGSTNLPAEVSPSFTTTLSVAKAVLGEQTRTLLFGSGPTTFSLDWARYRDPIINQTQFWNILFLQGFSWFSTLISTVGIVGIFAFVMFFIVSLMVFLRHLLRYPHEENTPLGLSIFIGFIALIFITVLYPANLTFVLMFFLMAGLLTSLLARPEQVTVIAQDSTRLSFSEETSAIDEEFRRIDASVSVGSEDKRGWFDIVMRTIRFESSWVVFVSSLLAIFFLSIGVAAAYIEIGRLRVALTQQHAVEMFNKGDIDGAIAQFERAATVEDRNYRNFVPLVQARMEKIRNLIGRAAGGNNVQQEFQTTVSLAIQNAQRAIQLHPDNQTLWILQGSLYELLIPFIPGSEKFAFESYRKAMEFDSLNPAIHINLARAGLVAVDRLTLTIQQSKGADRDQLIQVRTQALQEIMAVLEKAVDIKSDLADTHFLATQAALRLGNIEAAIQSAEKAKLAAPFDIGVAFQLGLLYYQASEFDKAQIEFERAVALNNNYSNARYFLGLIYDRKGDKEKAIAQFDQIQTLNPDNQEVKNILGNLRAKRSALDGIVPPATAPEKRTETPVREQNN
ncbi:MAG: tetratricopeptide repeat protein, partial [Candidatus Sungbacteria bacterium]|nr:tetratricopeptide repeat protein [Candidatus Sungbacteria bacterium]